MIPGGFDDPDAPGNAAAHHTGRPCIEPGCDNPAGTAWGRYWCFACNVARIDRISGQLGSIANQLDCAP